MVSCVGLTIYFTPPLLGFLLGRSLPRVLDEFMEIQLEALLLLGRAANELSAGKFDSSDAFHHSSTLLGLYLLSSWENWTPYAWLAVHMQILHFPMVAWYLGGRKACVLRSLRPEVHARRGGRDWLWDSLVLRGFRPLWLFAAAYRFALLAASALLLGTRLYRGTDSFAVDNEARSRAVLQTAAMACFGAVFSSLDLWWTQSFLSDGAGKVPWPPLAYAAAALPAGGIAACAVVMH